jgi:hypothetical protein
MFPPLDQLLPFKPFRETLASREVVGSFLSSAYLVRQYVVLTAPLTDEIQVDDLLRQIVDRVVVQFE